MVEEGKLERIRRHYKIACESDTKQREREREDLRFQVPELQWTDEARKERGGDVNKGILPRPMLSISKIDQPQRLVRNQMRQAQLGINVHPAGEDANDETAEIIQGLVRHIERKSRAYIARNWAFARAVAAGRGVYRVLTEYDPEGGHPSDQRIAIKRILNQESVYFDPSAQEPDYSDGKWAFVVSRFPREDYRRRWPKSKVAKATDHEWAQMAADTPDWFQDGDVIVAEYWYKEYEADDPETVAAVYCCTLNGSELIDEKEWNGKLIPLIPAVGSEIIPFDGERRFTGMISNAKDGQRLYNYAASTLVERMGLEPKTPFVGYAEQFEGYENEWQQINTRNLAFVRAKLTTADGKALPLPQRAQIDQSGMSLAMLALQEADAFIQATTSVYDPSLGRANPRDESGRKVLALQQQADASTSNYLRDFAEVAMTYEAMVILDLIPAIYDRPGRIARILRGDDDKSEQVMLNAPFVMQGDRPIPAQPGAEQVNEYNLRQGTYTVSVKVGKSFQTRLQEGDEFMTQILTAMPEYLPLLGDLIFRFKDQPGAKEIADRLSKMRERQFPGLGEGEDGKMSPEQAAAKLSAMEQQLQMRTMELQSAIKAIETDQAKQQATLLKTQMDNETKERIAAADNQTKLILEGLNQRFEALEALLARSHESAEHHKDMAHEAALAASQGQSMKVSGESGRDDERENEREETRGRESEVSKESSTETGGEDA